MVVVSLACARDPRMSDRQQVESASLTFIGTYLLRTNRSVRQKNVLLKAEHHRFQREKHIQLGALVRDYLDEHIATDTLDELPKRSERRQEIETVRTSIMVEQRHHHAVEEHDVNLSQVIDDLLSQRLERERKLSNIEDQIDGGEL